MISKAGGTKRYMAPELLAKKSPILATAADIYSLGVLVYVL
jgi:serine/threonine protein kinase